MNCRRARRELLQSPDRARGAAVRRHLRACSLCRGYAEAVARIVRPGIIPLQDPGEALVQRTLARIRDAAPCAAVRRNAARGRLHPLTAPAARVAWAAIAMVAAGILWRNRQPAHPGTAVSDAIQPEGQIAVLEEQLRLEAAWIDAWDPLDGTRGHTAWPEIGDDELDRLAEVFDEIAG